MRIAKTLDDLPVGTQVEIWLHTLCRKYRKCHKGIIYHNFNPPYEIDENGVSEWEYGHVMILFSTGKTKCYLRDDLEWPVVVTILEAK